MCIGASEAWAEDALDAPAVIDSDKVNPPSAYFEYPSVSIPLGKPGAVPIYDLRFPFNPETGFNTHDFKKVEVKAGEELKISAFDIGYTIAKSAVGRFNGTELPQFSEILNGLNTQDTEAFLKVVTRLAEEPRAAETKDEWERALERHVQVERRSMPPEKKGEQWLMFNPEIYGSGYFEVSGTRFSKGVHGRRYFVRLADVMNGRAQLDLKKLKLSVLKSLSVFVVRQLGKEKHRFKKHDETIVKMTQSLNKICEPGVCLIEGEKLGVLVNDLYRALLAGERERWGKKEAATLSARKHFCVFHMIHEMCPGLEELAQADQWVAENKLECQKVGSYTEGIMPE